MINHGMLEKYILARAQANFAKRREKLGAITTPADAAARQAEVRNLCAQITGPQPEPAPLNIKRIQTLERDGFNIEILSFQSLPGVIATANLYLPHDRPAPYPGVVCIPGQWPEGKARGDFQRLGRLLSRRGIAALLIDLVGQGERLEFYDSTLRRSWVGKNVQDEWAHLGNPMVLTGRHLGAYLAWDAMRALDVLVDHGGIDTKRLGISCAMGSENLGMLLCCQDERVSAAALTADLIENDSLGGDVQQNFFDAIPAGLVPLDLLVPFAPKRLLLTYNTEKPANSREATLAELRHWYGLLGNADAVSLASTDGAPPMAKESLGRAKIAEFFGRSFSLPEERVRELETPPEPAETLYATETGQVSNSLNAVSVFGWHKRESRPLPPPLEVPKDAAGALALQAEVRERFMPYLRLRTPAAQVSSQIESHSNAWGYMIEKGRLEIEDGLFVPYSLSMVPDSDGSASRRATPTVLALHERGIAGVSTQPPWMNGFSAAGVNVVAIDVCGIGETRLQTAQETRLQSVRETNEVAYDALLCGPESQWARRALNAGLSLFGLRVFSVLRTLAYLRTRPEISAKEISVVGVGRGGLWALYAAALDGDISRVALLRCLSSYKCLVEHRRHNHHFSLYLPGCLREFDLPHVAACVAPRPLTLINSVNQRKDRCDATAMKQEYALTNSVYKVCGAAGKFQITHADSAPETLEAVKAAIGASEK
jgi:dienelactone hydrolase